MEGKFSDKPVINEQEENDDSILESGPDSPCSMLSDMKMTSTSPPKKSKRGIQKKVVSVPITDVEGTRLKGENAPPPADSWAWRKYGQKPIKGSPYPRGYYRCSSSKGCPARKQVERSRVDPTMLVITYSFEHNHPWPPPSRNHHHHHNKNHTSSKPTSSTKQETATTTKPENPEPETEEKFSDLHDEHSLITTDEFSWFGVIETTSSNILESPFFSETGNSMAAADEEMAAVFFPMREEDESLFADLGELPECSSVFRQHRGGGVGAEVQIC